MSIRGTLLSSIVVVALVCGCGQKNQAGPNAVQPGVISVTAARLLSAGGDSDNWLSHGRTYDEQRFSPLSQITTDNVPELGLAWYFDIPTKRGIEATPIIVDGRMFVTGSWSIVYALDAGTGEELWRYDPQVDKKWARYGCCDVVNRGVAVWGNSVFVGTFDGYLVALDAASGEVRWRTDTINRKPPYTITGAPRVINGLVVIGNGGAEYGVRGYVSAYSADSGELVWRFFTVPGNPEGGHESEAMADAAKTWTGEWWKVGGGGTVWDSMAYDPELDLLYIGTGNGSPWNQSIRSPDGGDNLYLSSIVALRPDSGEYVWHYQTTPGETWDFTATQHMILAELEIDGAERKVIMQAPKNGFFYVVDRETGELLSAKNYVPVNWATHIDPQSGRPVEVADARWGGRQPYLQVPGPLGGHNWHPMSFSPDTGLVYIPAQEAPFAYGNDAEFLYKEGVWNTGANLLLASLPSDDATFRAIKASLKGRLLAWDPVKQEAAWSFEHRGPGNGGVLSTSGGLVFQGTADAHFAAYDASTGVELWNFFSQTGVVAAPASYAVDGEQYVAVAAGWGGSYALSYGGVMATGGDANAGRILAFKVGANGALPETTKIPASVLKPPAATAPPETVAAGLQAYSSYCIVCHGDHAQSSGLVPNLRYSPFLASEELWSPIVLDGTRAELGMGGYGDYIDAETSEAIRAYVISEANSGRDAAYYESVGKE
ncbi:MAG: PQQ-dependent dehydrogenase, methanol/ethanol family [Gammaproteobacteria bacterium]|nr:PQQ-dependent dehydrogenase, methanol/ethanol family [Gammaproteobacteria bacterium]NNL50080.1 PQQ-dependent dehydrogenase, methanol/ethanol family [Woeseiaceae bacterium]